MLKDLNMNKIVYLAMMLSLCISKAALAESEFVISKKNKFGGITKKTKYAEQDDSYKAGIQQVIDYYDSQGNRRKIEIYKRRRHSRKLDLDMIIHYKSSGREKISKRVSHYSKDDKLQKREYYFDKDSPVSKLGVDKRVIYYDDAGGATRVEHLDKSGKRVIPQ